MTGCAQAARLEELQAGLRLSGLLPHPVTILAVLPHGSDAVTVTYQDGDGGLGQRLLYRTDDGMVIVDYKTAATDDPAELARRVAGYRLQGGAYALAVRQTTGTPIARVCFAFLTPAGPVELDLADVDAAVAEVEALVAAGAEVEQA